LRFLGILDQNFDEARLAILVDVVLELLSEKLDLARLFLDYLVRGLTRNNMSRRLSRNRLLTREPGFSNLFERSARPYHFEMFSRFRVPADGAEIWCARGSHS
jgi:hypothetical protein